MRPLRDDPPRPVAERPASSPPRRLVYWRTAIVVGLGVALAYFALRSSPYLQYIPWMPRRVGVWADSHGIARNAVAFFALGLAVFGLVGRRVVHVVALGTFATALEVSQLWIRGRIFDWKDIVASLAGIAVAWPVAWLVRRCRV